MFLGYRKVKIVISYLVKTEMSFLRVAQRFEQDIPCPLRNTPYRHSFALDRRWP